mmetsp:Transcript_29351/g.47136  ORF Transcript_29351/g.47136 Transcript_29351/m.47136 type:complete len:230 (-) Transcript_29351:383-1072(-)
MLAQRGEVSQGNVGGSSQRRVPRPYVLQRGDGGVLQSVSLGRHRQPCFLEGGDEPNDLVVVSAIAPVAAVLHAQRRPDAREVRRELGHRACLVVALFVAVAVTVSITVTSGIFGGSTEMATTAFVGVHAAADTVAAAVAAAVAAVVAVVVAVTPAADRGVCAVVDATAVDAPAFDTAAVDAIAIVACVALQPGVEHALNTLAVVVGAATLALQELEGRGQRRNPRDGGC